jgi:serine protease AprX
LSTLLCSGASAPKSKVAKDFAKVDPGSTVNVIVQWKETPDATANQKVVNRGGSLRSVHQSIKAAAYRMPMSMVNDLANDPSVDHISIDHPIASKLDNSAAAINASAAVARGFDGTGIGVAVIDSGMVRNGDLTLHDTVVYNEDFTGKIKQSGDVKNTNNAPDFYGHGQHVAGIIASSGKSSRCGKCARSLTSIAPGVKLVNLRALDENGVGTDSTVIAAIERAIALKNTYNIRVINLSLGGQCGKATRKVRFAGRSSGRGKPASS